MTLLGSEHSILIRSKFRSVLQLRLQQRRTREQLADQGIMPLNHGKFPKQDDSYAFEEDSSSDSLSPEQHHSDESQGSACPSSEAVGSTPSSSSSPALTSPRQGGAPRDPPDQSQDEGLSGANDSQATPPIPVPAIVKSKTSDKNRHKKNKDVKPKVKKLKYHQYIPPDQKAEKSPPPMDSAYARLLQQQQLFLQLQILSQQKHSHTHAQTQQSQQHAHSPQTQAQQRQPAFSYHPHPPAQKSSSEQISACGSSGPSSTANSNSASPVKSAYPNQSNISPVKPGPLPANLDDLKVSELRQHLRIRGMPVSGTKTALIERLRPFKDSNAGSSPSGSSDITTMTFPVTPTGSLSSYQSPSSSSALSQGGYYPYPSISSTPPISPASSELSLSGSLPDSFSDVPMSSPTQFALQPSPAQLSMEDGVVGGGGNQGNGGQMAGEDGSMEGLEAEKDKMLVEKQKVIEELTWKLHQEQRQVEELKMQLHKRKRSYGATQDAIPPPSHPSMHHQQTPAMMGQHFFGVTIKQEPMSLSSSCPLSSPKQLKSPVGSCMEDMGHCNTTVSSLGGPVGPQCVDAAPSSGSPSTMSAFLSPQCSPQDSPNGKPSSSPQPSSPNNPYLLSPPLCRDGCSHPQPPGNSRGRNMQLQQKNGGPPVNCSYPSDQRGVQGVFPSSSDCGLNHNGSAKAENQHMQPKQLTRSQQMDELLDVLIESGGCPGLLIPRFHRHYEQLYPTQPPYDHSANHITESHLESLLGSAIGRGGEVAVLKMANEDGGLEDEGNREGHHHHPHHPPQDKLLPGRDQMDTPLSPVSTKASTFPEVQGMVSMAFSETPWETMEWLDLMPPSSTTTFSVAPPSGPSIFNTEFLDITDINLNSAMDLHLEQW
ncbi:myocardin isoform X2 [Echeneis naucrates]|uniref:myocardin isoform X2 n=1 Tax=Echeneis naucrates TaxID=173247 RepID=UPI001113F574|nr:myocardin isoform X2 [Echeneis naucrates]